MTKFELFTLLTAIFANQNLNNIHFVSKNKYHSTVSTDVKHNIRIDDSGQFRPLYKDI